MATPDIDDPDILEDPKDRGRIGFFVLIIILAIIAVGLLAGCMIYRQRYNACRYNNVLYCQVLQCADGSDPIEQARQAVEADLQTAGAGSVITP